MMSDDLMTPKKDSVLRHALGLTMLGGKPYRNHFVATQGGDDYLTCVELVRMGLMVETHPGNELTGGGACFAVTAAGFDALGVPHFTPKRISTTVVLQEERPRPTKRIIDIAHAREVLQRVRYPEYTLHAEIDGRGEMYLQGSYFEEDIYHPEEGKVIQRTRRWFISPEMTDSELVQTALKCILTSAEHRVREHFTYRGELVFGPHFDIEALVELAKSGKFARRE